MPHNTSTSTAPISTGASKRMFPHIKFFLMSLDKCLEANHEVKEIKNQPAVPGAGCSGFNARLQKYGISVRSTHYAWDTHRTTHWVPYTAEDLNRSLCTRIIRQIKPTLLVLHSKALSQSPSGNRNLKKDGDLPYRVLISSIWWQLDNMDEVSIKLRSLHSAICNCRLQWLPNTVSNTSRYQIQ